MLLVLASLLMGGTVAAIPTCLVENGRRRAHDRWHPTDGRHWATRPPRPPGEPTDDHDPEARRRRGVLEKAAQDALPGEEVQAAAIFGLQDAMYGMMAGGAVGARAGDALHGLGAVGDVAWIAVGIAAIHEGKKLMTKASGNMTVGLLIAVATPASWSSTGMASPPATRRPASSGPPPR